MKTKVLIAGGTGLIGEALVKLLTSIDYDVYVLSRKETDLSKKIYHWNPTLKKIDLQAIENTAILINLVGEGIADKPWTKKRKEALLNSRILPTQFLFEQFKHSQYLQHYISASGINCYGYVHPNQLHTENTPYGNDFLSQIVQKWEKSAEIFSPVCLVTCIRISVVLTNKGGALPKIAQPIHYHLGAPLGSGKQWIPWISLHDLCRLFAHTIQKQLSGKYNALAGTHSNQDFTKELAKFLNKKLWLPNVPGFILKAVLGEMSSVVLDGLQASNEKIKSTGFSFEDDTLHKAFERSYQKN